MLEVLDLHAAYGPSRVLYGVSLRAGSGEVVALLGRNGAGKSTTFKAIMGLLPPSAGRVIFRGEDIAGQPAHVICRKGIGFVPEDRRIFPDLTVRENLEVGRHPGANGGPAWTAERVFSLFPALRELERRRGDNLSGGEQQMLAIARTPVGNSAAPPAGQPSEGLAPLVLQRMAEHILRLKHEGMTILLSEQNLRFASRVSDRAYILEKGRIQFEGRTPDLMATPEALRRYLMV